MKFQAIMLLVVLLGALVMINADDTKTGPDGQDIIEMQFPVRGKIGNVNVNPAPIKYVSTEKCLYCYCNLRNCDIKYCYYYCFPYNCAPYCYL
jgi:hypothetical protein